MDLLVARCTHVEAVGHGRVRVTLDSEIVPAPGQLVLARLAPTHDPYLRRPLFPTQIWPHGFALELAPGDTARPFLNPGAEVSLLGPVGRRAPALPPGSNVLLIANLRPERLLPFAAQAIGGAGAVTLLLGRPYPLEALHPEIEVRVGHLAALVREYAGWADRVYVHTEPALPADLVTYILESAPAVDWAYVLLEPAMPCGVGACQACAVRTRRGWGLACKDGPLFSLSALEHDFS